MAILSDYEEEDHKKPTPSPPPVRKPFNAALNPSDPLGFLEKVFEFVARESDLFKSDQLVNDINAVVRMVKEKVEAEDRKRKDVKIEGNGKAGKKIKEEVPPEPVKKEEATKAPVKKEEAKKAPVKKEVPESEKKVEEKDGRRAPNRGNGLDMDLYTWVQTLPHVTITVPVPPGTKSRDITCEIKMNRIKVGLKGQTPVLDGELCHAIKVDDSFCSLEDQKSISILMTKQGQMEWWNYIVKGEPEIDTQKVEPESSKLADHDPLKVEPESRKLADHDPETRTAVEEMMIDEQMGLPTSDEMQKQDMLKFMAQSPKIDKDFEISHNSKSGSVYFYGYLASNPYDDEQPGDIDQFEDSDSGSESDEVPVLVPNEVKPEPKAKEEKKPVVVAKANAAAKGKGKESDAGDAGKQKVKIVEPVKDDSDDSTDEDFMSEDNSDSQDEEIEKKSSSSPSPLHFRRTVQRRHHGERIESSTSPSSPSPSVSPPSRPQSPPHFRRISRRSSLPESSDSDSSESSPKFSPQLLVLRRLNKVGEDRQRIIEKLRNSPSISVKTEADILLVCQLREEGFTGYVKLRPSHPSEAKSLSRLCIMRGLNYGMTDPVDYDHPADYDPRGKKRRKEKKKQGEPKIDTQKDEPESSKLADLDPETRTAVEEMMFDESPN